MNLSSFEKSGQSGLFTRGRRIYCNPTNAQSFHIPDGVTKIFAVAIGAGGGGEGIREDDGNTVSQGGAGGGYAHGVISGLTPGNTITCTVGLGGEGRDQHQSPQAGGTTSFGSYLTANGGGHGTSHSSYGSYFNYQTKEGLGGSASTSGVTEGHTAAGGGQSPGWARASDYSSYRGSAGGGASSGSPWGPGTSQPSLSIRGDVCGGAGWGSGMHRSSSFRFFLDANVWRGSIRSGDGSATQCNYACGVHYGNNSQANGAGGRGITARGGYIPTNRFKNHEQSSNGGVYALQYLPDVMDGQNGNPNWWFPWDIDGGGGAGLQGSSNDSSKYDYIIKGGAGGPGAGGGGGHASHSSSSPTQYYSQCALGGNGGLGGGGGGARCTGGSGNTRHAMCTGGDGGFGGGGGGAYTWTSGEQGTNYCYKGGTGGNGIIIVYW